MFTGIHVARELERERNDFAISKRRLGPVGALAALSFCLSACMAAANSEEDESVVGDSEAIVNGTQTSALPAVGYLGDHYCTATLISSRVILSAAHCFDFDNSKTFILNLPPGTPPSYPSYTSTSFTIEASDGRHTYDVGRYALLGSGYGSTDLAVAELLSDVPASQATPLQPALFYPANNASVTQYGYGAYTGWYDDAGWHDLRFTTGPDGTSISTAIKRKATVQWDAANKSTNPGPGCPGDSGGPVVAGQTVVGVLSYGTCTGSNPPGDTLADPIANAAWINKWNAIFGNKVLCTFCNTVALKTNDGVHYLQAVNAGGSSTNATPTAIGSWETFKLVPLTLEYWGFQTHNGNWLTAENGGNSTLAANRTLLRAWETFKTSSGAQFATIGSPQYFMCAENGGGGAVNVNRSAQGAWETFTLVNNVPW
jgi:V8-like Glu-specific endopeptidase